VSETVGEEGREGVGIRDDMEGGNQQEPRSKEERGKME